MSETANDPRVRRFASALGKAGHRVLAFNPQGQGMAERTVADGFEIVRVPSGSVDDADVQRLLLTTPTLRRALDGTNVIYQRFSVSTRIRHQFHKRVVRVFNLVRRRTGYRLERMRKVVDWVGAQKILDAWRLRVAMLSSLRLAIAARSVRPEIVICNDSNTLLPGLVLREHTGAKLIFDAHEAFTEQWPEGEGPELIRAVYRLIEAAAVPLADACSTVCDSVGRFYVERYGARPFRTIRNVPSRRFLVPPDLLARMNQPRIAIYQGAYFRFRGLEPLIDSAKHLKKTILHLRGIGDYGNELRERAERQGVGDRVRFLPPVTVDELVGGASHADIGLNPFPSLCLNTAFALPNKFFEYLMAGLATASSDLVELRSHTERYRTGVLFTSLEPEQIARDLDALSEDGARLDECRHAAWTAARDELNWETEQERLLEMVRGL
ncbi:MAG: glycosyltransferase [Deltaproteobacteria bacterium]|nr:glycosyltransferase [Deltaproteobacteria bacterium]